MTLTLEIANCIVDAALAEARRLGLKPMGVIVLDAGGHPMVYKREDHSALFRYEIAFAKAKGALGMGMDTRELAQRASANLPFFLSLPAVTGGEVALSAGGLVIRDAQGHAIGAVAVSGDKSELDEACAVAGLVAAGLGQRVHSA